MEVLFVTKDLECLKTLFGENCTSQNYPRKVKIDEVSFEIVLLTLPSLSTPEQLNIWPTEKYFDAFVIGILPNIGGRNIITDEGGQYNRLIVFGEEFILKKNNSCSVLVLFINNWIQEQSNSFLTSLCNAQRTCQTLMDQNRLGFYSPTSSQKFGNFISQQIIQVRKKNPTRIENLIPQKSPKKTSLFPLFIFVLVIILVICYFLLSRPSQSEELKKVPKNTNLNLILDFDKITDDVTKIKEKLLNIIELNNKY